MCSAGIDAMDPRIMVGKNNEDRVRNAPKHNSRAAPPLKSRSRPLVSCFSCFYLTVLLTLCLQCLCLTQCGTLCPTDALTAPHRHRPSTVLIALMQLQDDGSLSREGAVPKG